MMLGRSPGSLSRCYDTEFPEHHAGNCFGHRARREADAGLEQDDPAVLVHEALCRILDCALVHDQLHITQCASLAQYCRAPLRVQLRYRDRF